MEAKKSLHPLVAGAAVAVIIAAGVAVAAVTGVIPGSNAEPEKQQVVTPQKPQPKPVALCKNCGTVVSVKEVDVPGKGTGLGAVAGGVGGAVIGREIGDGNRAGTVVGAAVGAVAGHQIERQARMHKRYDITVKMNDGSIRNLSDESGNPVSVKSGDKVRVAQDGSIKKI